MNHTEVVLGHTAHRTAKHTVASVMQLAVGGGAAGQDWRPGSPHRLRDQPV